MISNAKSVIMTPSNIADVDIMHESAAHNVSLAKLDYRNQSIQSIVVMSTFVL